MDQTAILNRNAKIKEAGNATRLRRDSMACKVFKVKIDKSELSTKQKEQLKMMFIEGKWLANHIIDYSEQEGQTIFDYRLNPTITRLDKDKNIIETELKWTGSHIRQAILQELRDNVATLAKLKRKGHKVGQLKHKSELKSINLKQYNITWKVIDRNHIQIQGVKKKIRVRGMKQFYDIKDIEYANAKLLNTPSGYYLGITTYQPKEIKEKKNKDIIGIDLGCATSINLSDGRKIDVRIEESRRLLTLQRKLKRQVKGSKRYNKTRIAIQKIYQKTSNKKNDITNKIINKLSQYNTIVMQDEQIASWKKVEYREINGNKQKIQRGKKIQKSILGRIKTKLSKQDNVVILSQWAPTTKLCTNCGKYHDIPENIRTFTCDCGIVEDRDIHAANNMIWMYRHNIGLEQAEYKRIKIAIDSEFKRRETTNISDQLLKCEGATL